MNFALHAGKRLERKLTWGLERQRGVLANRLPPEPGTLLRENCCLIVFLRSAFNCVTSVRQAYCMPAAPLLLQGLHQCPHPLQERPDLGHDIGCFCRTTFMPWHESDSAAKWPKEPWPNLLPSVNLSSSCRLHQRFHGKLQRNKLCTACPAVRQSDRASTAWCHGALGTR